MYTLQSKMHQGRQAVTHALHDQPDAISSGAQDEPQCTAEALCWMSMHVSDCRERGDPGLPFHKEALLASLAKAGAAAVDEQDFTEATKLKVKAAIIAQHREQAEHAARALRGLSHVRAAGFCNFHDELLIAPIETHA